MAEAGVRVRYLGEGEKYLDLPVPFMYLSERTGSVVLNPVGLVDEASARHLVENWPDLYEIVSDAAAAPVAAKKKKISGVGRLKKTSTPEEMPAPSADDVVGLYRGAAPATVAALKIDGGEIREHPDAPGIFEVFSSSPARPEEEA